jgi:hypothetical protein
MNYVINNYVLVGTRDLQTLWSPPVSLNQKKHTQKHKAAIYLFIVFDENLLKSLPAQLLRI